MKLFSCHGTVSDNIYFMSNLFIRCGLLFYMSNAYAFKCAQPYNCLTRAACNEVHASSSGLQNTVMFRCDSLGHKVCCPPVNGLTPSTGLERTGVNTGTIEKPIKSKKGRNDDLLEHKSYSLLPPQDVCGLPAPDDSMTLSNKVAFGEESEPGTFPWMAVIYYKIKTGDKEQFDYIPLCGGTLITGQHILTAAHCIQRQNATVSHVRLAVYNIKQNKCTVTEKNCPITVNVSRSIVHSKYSDEPTYHNDIALLRLERPVWPSENKFIVPICLPFDLEKLENATTGTYDVVGWGLTEKGGLQLSKVLRNATIDNLKRCDFCERRPNAPGCPIKPKEQICIKYTGKSNVCEGDSGGPLMSTGFLDGKRQQVIQVGIVSFSKKSYEDRCGLDPYPSIFTKVSNKSYLKWILSNIGN